VGGLGSVKRRGGDQAAESLTQPGNNRRIDRGTENTERRGNMLVWLLIAIALAILGVIELLLNFTIPFVEYRTIILFLLILGMSYRIYNMERSGEKENMRERVRELEDKIRELEMGKENQEEE
jgi:hypothetical protein